MTQERDIWQGYVIIFDKFYKWQDKPRHYSDLIPVLYNKDEKDKYLAAVKKGATEGEQRLVGPHKWLDSPTNWFSIMDIGEMVAEEYWNSHKNKLEGKEFLDLD